MAGSSTSVGSSAALSRPPEEAHAEQSRRARSGSAALRETRTEELRNPEAGVSNDIVPMIPANGAPHDLEARDAHRSLSFA